VSKAEEKKAMSDETKTEQHGGFNANHFYRGKVTRQLMSLDQKGVPFAAFYVKLEGMLVDLRNPDSGILKAPDAEVEVRLRFDENNSQFMEYSINDLDGLGFHDEDLSKLDPSHDDHKSFVGQTVYVTPVYKATAKGSMCFWNFRFPRQYKVESAGADRIAGSGSAQVFKSLMAARRKDKDSQPAEAEGKGGKKAGKEKTPF
jgi:hypothetical protein